MLMWCKLYYILSKFKAFYLASDFYANNFYMVILCGWYERTMVECVHVSINVHALK